jgi:hypothetical protein
MNPWTVLTAALLFAAQAAPAQTWLAQHPEVWQRIKDEARSPEWKVRSTAFHEARTLAGTGTPESAEFFFNLLRTENEYLYVLVAKGESPAEGWGDPYYSGLLGICTQLLGKNPSAERFRIVASGSYNPGSDVAQALGRCAGEHLVWVAEQSRTSSNEYRRANSLGILIHWLTSPGGGEPAKRAVARGALQAGVEDPSGYVRVNTAHLLGEAGTEETCGILRVASQQLKQRRGARANDIVAMEKAMKKCGDRSTETEVRRLNGSSQIHTGGDGPPYAPTANCVRARSASSNA